MKNDDVYFDDVDSFTNSSRHFILWQITFLLNSQAFCEAVYNNVKLHPKVTIIQMIKHTFSFTFDK